MKTWTRIGHALLCAAAVALILTSDPALMAAWGAARALASDPPEQDQAPPQSAQAPQNLHLLAGRSLLITSPAVVKRVSLADPNIADAIIVSPYQILLNGKQPGSVSLLVWDANDQSQAFDIYVDLDILALNQKIHEVFPNEAVQLEASKDVVMLSGKVSSKAIADKIYAVVSSAVPKVISLMEVPPAPAPPEILLEVKFAELDLGALNNLGVNLFTFPGSSKTFGTVSTGQFSPPTPTITPGTNGTATTYGLGFGQALNFFLYRTDLNAGMMLEALAQKNVLQILAEPNLLAESGKDSSFLEGGQFPVPVVQGGASGSVPTVSIVFKDYGIKLNFHPDITEDGHIHLKVEPSVSTLDYANAVTLSGFVIPALATRSVEAEMILDDGQSFAIAGLEDQRVTDTSQKVPGIGNVPVLGNLFKSKSLNKTRTELIILVTPHIVHPITSTGKKPEVKYPEKFMPPSKQTPETPTSNAPGPK
ncbi:MAG: pilus assembly protein N-terminal domain-containing protein [Candidatus Acidiferrales bacterium]